MIERWYVARSTSAGRKPKGLRVEGLWNPGQSQLRGWVGHPRSWLGNHFLSAYMLVLPAECENVLRLNIFTLRCGGWERKDRRRREEKGMTGVRGGGGVLERGGCVGSSPCRKDLTLFASIILPFAETLNLLVRPKQPVGVMHSSQKRPVVYKRKTAENTSRGNQRSLQSIVQALGARTWQGLGYHFIRCEPLYRDHPGRTPAVSRGDQIR